MFNKYLLVLVLVAATGSSFSAPVANLKINGEVIPPTCTINSVEQADLVFEFGTVAPKEIPASGKGYNFLPSLKNDLTVLCDAKTYLTFKPVDMYTNEFIMPPNMPVTYDSHVFKMVDAAAPEKTIGGITYMWLDVYADGVPAFLSRANDGTNDSGQWARANWFVKNATIGWTKKQQIAVPRSELDLISAKEFKASIYNYTGVGYGYSGTYILPVSELTKQGIDISEGVNYTSNVALVFNFGI
ncbi:type 1 fimbrial protein [Serratia fonticola]|uniref:fimbrial protein n=1 Tax=Serratia fonticola TaxID=47917 RepID=UPI0015C5FDA1|nr:type 1 fimbrial protein [Serratia fonticola]NXZ88103.1 type 1 fimbrial protein [Serratia fonticola]